jgi:hypothetical protein
MRVTVKRHRLVKRFSRKPQKKKKKTLRLLVIYKVFIIYGKG